ncbi:AfsA-related hotdog domain-containing protein [Helicobacter mesocricetorum]|uniref:AfsA-related hotdog domain-containing protein n=1 Tax=Helicobacter mesocricetorum TaxID=87012 RepID=UPI000CF18B71|nr:AfsA-related hotdog domain-containing protein [Helicobacter mesocricetorum]
MYQDNFNDKILKRWQPCFDNVVSKRFVHKAFLSEVFLTDSHKYTDDTFLISAFLPRSHLYYNDSIRQIDVSLVLEVFRQCSIYISHSFCSIPIDFKFIFDSAHFNILNNYLDSKNVTDNYRVVIVAKIVQSKIKKGILVGIVLDMSMYINSQLYATKTMDISFFQPKIWEKLRRSAQNVEYSINNIQPAPKEMVAKKLDSNIAIGNLICNDKMFCSTLMPNMQHPAFFDHPLDHIPASLIFESLRQHALFAAFQYNVSVECLSLKEIIVEFKSFCEFFNVTQCCSERNDVYMQNDDFMIDIQVISNDKVCVVSKLKFAILRIGND